MQIIICLWDTQYNKNNDPVLPNISINKIKNNVSNRVKMSFHIYISIGLLTCFTDVYATLLLGGVLSIRNTLLSKNSKLY